MPEHTTSFISEIIIIQVTDWKHQNFQSELVKLGPWETVLIH